VAAAGLLWLLLRKEKETPLAVIAPAEGPSEASLKDPISGLYNRKHLIQRIKELMSKCDRGQEKMALILWDIDGFVQFNNRFGQAEGDKLLKKVGEVLKNSIRIYDEAFRSGPDEFCTVLTPANQKAVDEVTKRVRDTVGQNLLKDPAYTQQKFSVSSGIVSYPSEHKLPEALLYAAQQELYKTRITSQ
jgi:diguanylate cyclase (GGDEF)-like protein